MPGGFMKNQLLRRIPGVDDLLRHPALRVSPEIPAPAVTEAVRRTAGSGLAGEGRCPFRRLFTAPPP